MIQRNEEGFWKGKNLRLFGIIFILIGVSIRIFMLIYYYVRFPAPGIQWGDVWINYHTTDSMFTGEWVWDITELEYPPLTLYLLVFFKFISFGVFEVFVFYSFALELITSLAFYYILKKFNLSNKLFILGIFLINPFIFLNNVFSAISCGYHITDSFLYIFLLFSLYYYPREDKSMFYLFSGLTMSVKWFTLPAAIYFFLKFLLKKDLIEMKKILIYIGIPIVVFLLSPFLYLPNYIDLYLGWLSSTEESVIYNPPLFIKLILFGGIFLLYLIFRLRKADLLEITFFSIIVMFSIMFWRRLYIRYLTPLILYGHITTKQNILTIDIDLRITKVKFRVGNHIFTYFMSILGCIVSIAIILFIF